MASRKLPHPISVTDEILVEIHDLLGEIRDRLPAPKAAPKRGEPTPVEEPGTAKRRGSSASKE